MMIQMSIDLFFLAIKYLIVYNYTKKKKKNGFNKSRNKFSIIWIWRSI